MPPQKCIAFLACAVICFCLSIEFGYCETGGTPSHAIVSDSSGGQSGSHLAGWIAQSASRETLKTWSNIAGLLEGSGYGDVDTLPIRTDIHKGIELGVCSLQHHLNRGRQWPAPLNDPQNRNPLKEGIEGYPELYWGANGVKDGTAYLYPHDRKHPLEISVSHVVGRGLWASLLAEQVVGIEPQDRFFDVLYQYCRDMFDNIDRLPSYYDAERHFERAVIGHDMREGFLALLGLMRTRDDEWARETAKEMVLTLKSVTDEKGHLSPQLAEEVGLGNRIRGMGCDATTSGRLVEPLIDYWAFTGDEEALTLAGRFAAATVDSAFLSDGKFAPFKDSGGHIHSITSSLAGLIRYALVSGDADLLEKCFRIMENGIPLYFSSWGWGDEVMPDHPANVVGRGETNQTGDVIRAALLLGEAGYPQYYEMAERYLRSMLLPTQYWKEDLEGFLRPNTNPKGDWEKDVIERTTGGFAMQLPNDRMMEGVWPLTTPDIISGAVHALCACYQHRVTSHEEGVRVNLLFDAETEEVVIKSSLPREGSIAFTMKSEKNLSIRIPEWVDKSTLSIVIGGPIRDVRIEEGYVVVKNLQPGDFGKITFNVPCKTEKELVDGTEYTTTWIGNQIIDIQPQGSISPLPFGEEK